MHTNNPLLSILGLRPTGDLGPLTAYTTRRNKVTWFLKAPPTKPPTDAQRRQHLAFTAAAQAWRALTQGTRDAWNTACRRAGLYLHGYQLWIHWQTVRDRPTIATIEHQSGCTLIP